jgi:hypothetical protein
VPPPGHASSIAGYSEGGFCAANQPGGSRFGYAGVLSGYKPYDNQLGHPARRSARLAGISRSAPYPVDLGIAAPRARSRKAWASAPQSVRYQNAEIFGQLVQSRQPGALVRARRWPRICLAGADRAAAGMDDAARDHPGAASRPACRPPGPAPRRPSGGGQRGRPTRSRLQTAVPAVAVPASRRGGKPPAALALAGPIQSSSTRTCRTERWWRATRGPVQAVFR